MLALGDHHCGMIEDPLSFPSSMILRVVALMEDAV